MKMATKLFLATLVVLALPAMALAQGHAFPYKTVCDVRIDNDGDCSADAVGDTVCVEGVVVAWKEFGNRGPGAIWDPVSGCCISIFDIDMAGPQAVGDLVEICGWVGPFAGLDEIADEPGTGIDPTVMLISQGNNFPCTPVTALDLADGSTTAEGHESCLVSICGTFELAGGNFSAGSANYNFIDAQGDTCQVRIDSDTGIGGTAIPAGSVTLKGIFAQFDGFGANLCGGYQLLPRSLADITPSSCTVAVDEVIWSDVKDKYREDDED